VRDWNEPVLGGFLGAVCGLLLHLAFTPGKKMLLLRLSTASRSGIFLYALLGVLTILGQIFGIAAMRYIPMSIATLITLCTPVLVFPLSYLLFRTSDDFTPKVLGGTALTLLGIFIIVMR
jgi:drug/metabolite transporter (DMT)-like permease